MNSILRAYYPCEKIAMMPLKLFLQHNGHLHVTSDTTRPGLEAPREQAADQAAMLWRHIELGG